MNNYQPTGIQIHLSTGRKHLYYQRDPVLVSEICDDVEGNIFSRSSLIIDSEDDVVSFQGDAVIGITILTSPLPDSFYKLEAASKSVVMQISQETFHFRRLQILSHIEGTNGVVLSELQFTSGESLYLEINEVVGSSMAERSTLHRLFERPSISCRRLDGGFGIWNTKHIVSWSHYPKLEAPKNAWPVESIAEQFPGKVRIVETL